MERTLKTTFTLGPASAGVDVIRRLHRSADRFRLNGSHLTPETLQVWLERLAEIYTELGPCPVVLDLQGAKMRVGRYPTVDCVPARLTLRLADASDDPAIVPVPHAPLFAAVRPGELLSFNDDKVRARVESVGPDELKLVVTHRGPLAANKGVNRMAHPVPFSGLLERDRRLMVVAEAFPFVEYAFSFVHTGAEAAALRQLTDRRLSAKIERPEACEHLVEIDRHFDELWFCRGDLGAQAGLRRLGPLQAQFTAQIPRLKHAVLAGQVLEHMTRAPVPTRSEVVHLYDAAQAGWAGLVCSDETAVGDDPERVADLLDELLTP